MSVPRVVSTTLLGLIVTLGTAAPSSALQVQAQDQNPAYTITDIGVLTEEQDPAFNDHGSTVASDINATGDVTGSARNLDASSVYSNAIYYRDGKLLNLTGDYRVSVGQAINAKRRVAGYVGETCDGSSLTNIQAVLWKNREPVELVGLSNGGSAAFGLSNRDHVVGQAQIGPAADDPWHAVLWRSGEIVDLGTLGGATSYAVDVTEDERVVGTSQLSTMDEHAFLWENGELTDLGALMIDDLPSIYSRAAAITENGRIVGFSGYGEVTHAFRWEDGDMIDLGVLKGQDETADSYAYDANAQGQIVGAASDQESPLGGSAVIWNGEEISNLNNLVPEGSGWWLTSANAINDSGQIAGSGIIDGESGLRGFILTPAGQDSSHDDSARFSIGLSALLTRDELSH